MGGLRGEVVLNVYAEGIDGLSEEAPESPYQQQPQVGCCCRNARYGGTGDPPHAALTIRNRGSRAAADAFKLGPIAIDAARCYMDSQQRARGCSSALRQ